MRDFFEAMPLDRADIPKMIVNPITGGDYAGLLVAKKNRRVDDIIYRALRGTVTFKDSTTAALPAGQKIAASATGFTKSKLISARKLFRANEADGHNGEELCIAYDSEMLEDILSDTTLTSADFLAVRMLQDGDVSRNWMGFKWTPYNAIENSGGTRFTVAWCKSAVHFGTGFLEGDAGPRRDKKNTQQVSLAASFGAVRTSEKKAVEIAFV
jgi:hypothetical protein